MSNEKENLMKSACKSASLMVSKNARFEELLHARQNVQPVKALINLIKRAVRLDLSLGTREILLSLALFYVK